MAFQYLTNIPLEKAREEYLAALIAEGFAPETELLPVQEANGRITAEAVYAHISAPHYPASAMDGIALAAKDTFGATETTPVTLQKDRFTVVDTGDPVPDGCDAVIMVEDLVYNEDGSLRLYASAAPWQHVRQIGEDICAGEMILASHIRITPAAIGSMLAGGVLHVPVLKRPVVGLIPTGDEIVPPTADPKAGDIIEFNTSIFAAMLSEWGAEPRVFPIVKDELPLIRDAVAAALCECDAVVLNAGSSAGREDYSAEVIGMLGKVLCHGIAIKPGKPAILGYSGKKPILGVPGYPVSGIIVMEELMKPIVQKWYRTAPISPEYCAATLARPVVSGLKYQEFVRVRMGKVGEKLIASPLGRGSGIISSFMKADGILEIPQGQEGYAAGEEVRVRLLRPM
ncbi:MAG: molybdopterin biosynthesis protein, partial [Clostridia bacterium]|nr:molybdopterin biosynthesis protein [Clostridia bacterium]